MTNVFRIYDLVRVPCENPYMASGEAIISGRDRGEFKLFFKNHGEVSWFTAEDMELIKRHQPQLLNQWELALAKHSI